jgi:predicted RNA-binding protein YlxR (DUF448 family)
VNSAAAIIADDMRERRCIATGEVLPEASLVRFAADPEGKVVPDIGATLPGRGMWVRADRKLVAQAVARNLFSKSARAALTSAADLPDRVEQLLVARMRADLGLARRAGQLVLGFDNVMRSLEARLPPAVLIEASDGAEEGRKKIASSARARGLKIETIDQLTAEELSLALGRQNVIHAALKPGRLAERLIFDAGRLGGFRPASSARKSAGSTPAPNERRE